MDRAYYQLIEETIEATRLATAVVQNADYKACIKEATDPIIIDAIKETQRLKRYLQEIINRQEYANVKSLPG
jgi:hypothetical protein